MTFTQTKIPTHRRFFRAAFSWRTARRILLAGAFAFTILAIFYAEEDWRGQRDWEAYKAKVKQAGEPFNSEEMQPPPVPDDQNFAMTPSLMANQQQGKYSIYGKIDHNAIRLIDFFPYDSLNKLGNGQPIDLNELAKPLTAVELIEAMKQFDPVLDEFTTSSRRPATRFPESFSLLGIFKLTRVYQLRAVVELAEGQTDRATEDVLAMFRIARHLTSGVTLTDQLISCADSIVGAEVLQYGLVHRLWATDQLYAMQGALDQVDYVAALHRGYLAAQVGLNGKKNIIEWTWGGVPQRGMVHLMSVVLPSGWVDQNLLSYNKYFSELVSAINVSEHRFDVQGLTQIETQYSHQSWTPYNFMALAGVRNVFGILRGGVMDVELLDEAKVDCALERYRLANGKLPDNLDELTPQFITKIPTNVATGGPLHYQKLADDHYQLFAVGWGEKEDGSNMPGKAAVIWYDTPASK